MGWLSMTRSHMGCYSTPKEYLEAQFTYARTLPDRQTKNVRILDSALVDNAAWYGACEIRVNEEPPSVIAVICLVQWNPRAADGFIFGYKDMDESADPYQANCPARILRLLTETSCPNALDWRRRCEERIRLKARKITNGMKIRFPSVITFTDGYAGTDFIVIKDGNRVTFRDLNGHGPYHISRFREKPWSVVSETKVYRTVFTATEGLTA